jgi:hypothetical protein
MVWGMKLRTVVRDCLFLNWALPADALPEPPAPLRYQRHAWQGRDYVFASALLFHHDAVRWSAFPLLRVGYPQLNVRLYVLDDDGVPSVLFLRELMPAWVAPGVRLVSHHPAASAHLDFPRPSRQTGADSWSWRVERGAALTVRARVHSPTFGEGPRIGSWDETVRYIQDRPRGYAVQRGALHRVDASHPPVAGMGVWPLAAEVVGGDALLRRLLPLAPAPMPPMPPMSPWAAVPAAQPHDGDGSGAAAPTRVAALAGAAGGGASENRAATAVLAEPGAATTPPASSSARAEGFSLPALHSSWLCPEMPFSIVFDLVPKVQPQKTLVQHLPHPAAGRITSPALRAEAPRSAAAAAPAELAEIAAGGAVLASAA